MAACQGAKASKSLMAREYPALVMPTEQLRGALAQKLDMTLGRRVLVTGAGTPPARARPQQVEGGTSHVQQTMDLARWAMAATEAAQKRAASMYEKGMEQMTARSQADSLAEPGHKGFGDSTRARIKGFCQARTWDEVPKIWHEIEK